jgi:2-oxoglutarate dehydrogenase E2 component (dihydrolipoamide succinyltransferase)
MAESITEGTLKTWSKKVGDSVAQDEEVATIETDKVRTGFRLRRTLPPADHCATQIDVQVNSPQAGTIIELLAKEEDTVTVGQDLFRIEPGEGSVSCSKALYMR